MGRAQKRDASASSKFYFRKDVFSAVESGASSVTSSSGDSTPSDESPRKKAKKMGNCFPPPPLPQNGVYRLPVDEEYDEFTMDEIMNGKVSWSIVMNFFAKIVIRERPFQVFCLWWMLISIHWRSISMTWKGFKATWNLFDVGQTACVIHLISHMILADVATGTLSTPATWIRNFVQSHPDYKKDSVVSQVINYDLLMAVDEM